MRALHLLPLHLGCGALLLLAIARRRKRGALQGRSVLVSWAFLEFSKAKMKKKTKKNKVFWSFLGSAVLVVFVFSFFSGLVLPPDYGCQSGHWP